MARPEDPRSKRTRRASKSEEQFGDTVEIALKNDKWKAITPFFERYLEQKHTSPKDVTRTTSVKYVARPVIRDDDQEDTVEVEEEIRAPMGPLQQHPVESYALQLIMTGDSVPKAVVVDPSGQAFVIQRDTQIGDKGGVVEVVTQYMVLVREPNQEDPIQITLQPPYIDLASQYDRGPEAYGARPSAGPSSFRPTP